MMAIDLYIRSVLIGLSIAAVVGPMSVLVIQRTLIKGYLYGLVSGLGIATADAIYGSIAGFGLTVVSHFLVSERLWIRLLGGLFLIYLGIKSILTKPPERTATAEATNYVGAYATTLLLTLTNPLTILSFAAIFAGIGVAGSGKSTLAALTVVLGVFSGSVLWWLLLTGVLRLLRGRFTSRWLLWINRCSGAMIALFGLLALLSLG